MSQDSVSPSPENVILQTKNYGMFKFDPLNRAIRQDKLDRLYTAVEVKNLLHLFPIVVTRDFVIVDGQHRCKVAEALDTPIYYIVSSQMRIEDAARVNNNTDSWKQADYLQHWCGLGLPDYLRLKEFWEQRQWMTPATAVSLCHTGSNTTGLMGEKPPNRLFADGEYIANNLDGAERIATMVCGFKTWVAFWKDRPFISAIRNLDSNVDYDHARMMQKMQYQSSKLVRCASAEDYIAVLNTIYNYKVPDDRKVLLKKIGSSSSKWRD